MVDAVVHDLAGFAGLEVQDGHLWPVVGHEALAHCRHELLGVLHQVSGEAVDSEVDGREVLDVGGVGEDADVGPGPEAAEAVDELDVAGFEEDQIGSDFEGERNGAKGLLVSHKSLLVLEDTLVGSRHLGLLGNLSY